jgi:hypothetical protein
LEFYPLWISFYLTELSITKVIDVSVIGVWILKDEILALLEWYSQRKVEYSEAELVPFSLSTIPYSLHWGRSRTSAVRSRQSVLIGIHLVKFV